jgi:hypothetical protein
VLTTAALCTVSKKFLTDRVGGGGGDDDDGEKHLLL